MASSGDDSAGGSSGSGADGGDGGADGCGGCAPGGDAGGSSNGDGDDCCGGGTLDFGLVCQAAAVVGVLQADPGVGVVRTEAVEAADVEVDIDLASISFDSDG